jgi:hypothetical protein
MTEMEKQLLAQLAARHETPLERLQRALREIREEQGKAVAA